MVGRAKSQTKHQKEVSEEMEELIQTAMSTSAGFLVSDSPIKANNPDIPLPEQLPILPISDHIKSLLQCSPNTDLEVELLAVFRDLTLRGKLRDEAARSADATLVLQGLNCARLKRQLPEEQKESKCSGRLLSDGLPVLLTDDAFHAKAAERASTIAQKARSKAAKKRANDEYKTAVETWKKEKEARAGRTKLEPRSGMPRLSAGRLNETWRSRRSAADQHGENQSN